MKLNETDRLFLDKIMIATDPQLLLDKEHALKRHHLLQRCYNRKHDLLTYLHQVDRLILGGSFFAALAARDIPVSVERQKPNKSTPGATRLRNGKFTIHIRTKAGSRVHNQAEVGNRRCYTREGCDTALILHEFVHMLEFYLRAVTGCMTGYSEIDQDNVLFRKWLWLLIGQEDVYNYF